MAFDGITIASVVQELNEKIVGGRILKIAQPEKDELIITVKNEGKQYRLLISADPSLPLIYLTEDNKPSPLTAPTFCMLLRKHLQNAKFISFSQPDFERIVRIEFEHLNEMGDLCTKTLIVELMGRYSNIIFVDDKDVIVDSIRRVSSAVSSVREVLPGREYFLPKVLEKKNPMIETRENFLGMMRAGDEAKEADGKLIKPTPVFKAIYMEYTGIAPLVAKSMCLNAGISLDLLISDIDDANLDNLWKIFNETFDKVRNGQFEPTIYYEDGVVLDYASIDLPDISEKKKYDTISELLFIFYSEKNIVSRIRQRSYDIRRVVQNAIDRTKKKIDIQEKQFEDTAKRETYKIYGELLNAYGYSLKDGEKSAEVLNYYDNQMITIPLDPMYSVKDNARKYFDKYGKLKRTYEALTTLMEENKKELMHLESIMTSLDIARSEDDLVQIKEELIDSGYVRRRRNLKKPKITSKPFHYISSAGYDIYVGKNNYQNEEISFKLASGKDMWFHAKNAPGSHVIVKVGDGELPDSVYEEAASLAAFYSSVKDQDKVEIDYTARKNLKKPAGSAPGFVIYHTNYSMMATPSTKNLKQV